MRTIEFRGQSLTLDKRWLYGSYLTRLNSRGGREHFIVSDDGVEYACDEKTVGQFTGLLDKNGKEIYEGDIIKYDEDEIMNHWVSGAIAKILLLPGRFTARMNPFERFNGSNQNTLNEDFEDSVTIIGNIYENPELLTTN